MTEDEAKTKWCPFVRLAIREDGNHHPTWAQTNRDEDVNCEAATHCIASACMSWRWNEAKRTAAFLEAVQRHMQGQDKPNFNTATQKVFAETGGQFERVEGFCGLAGAVQ